MKVLLAVGGGIAAYKSAELACLLMQQGHQFTL
jgi:phosphopantothenoylcysteine synthetase/decarboxylase